MRPIYQNGKFVVNQLKASEINIDKPKGRTLEPKPIVITKPRKDDDKNSFAGNTTSQIYFWFQDL